jgi:hypothetical protein
VAIKIRYLKCLQVRAGKFDISNSAISVNNKKASDLYEAPALEAYFLEGVSNLRKISCGNKKSTKRNFVSKS